MTSTAHGRADARPVSGFGPRTCRTCGVAFAPSPVFDADEGVTLPPSAYCSIHCEHYDGLARAARRGEA